MREIFGLTRHELVAGGDLGRETPLELHDAVLGDEAEAGQDALPSLEVILRRGKGRID